MSMKSKKRRDIKRKRKGLKGRPAREPGQSDPCINGHSVGAIMSVMGMGDSRVSLHGGGVIKNHWMS